MEQKSQSVTPFKDIVNYSIGEGATSISMNGVNNFAMLYYAKVLGMDAKYAGMALGLTLLWDAVSDPIMGHLTDNTRSRFGRRHPYMFFGGLATAAAFFFLWFVPDFFKQPAFLFGYLVVINLIFRTAMTVFLVPYTALGFEICTEYEGRSRLQSVRYFVNQAVNFFFGAMAWILFFPDRTNQDGSRLDGTHIASNYFNMSIILTITTAVLILYCVYFTRRYAADTRCIKTHNSFKSFLSDFAQTISDKYALYVFLFIGIAQLGMMVVAQVQMFTYVDFMKFTAFQKTVVHGAGMIAFGLGALLQAQLVRRYDKKQAGYAGVFFCIFGNAMLWIIFLGGLLPPETYWAIGKLRLPVSVIMFGIFQGMWWGGCGMLIPLSTSMIADISEIHQLKTGILKDGSYSAVFSFVLKFAMAVGMYVNGCLMNWVGYVSGVENQTPDVIRKLAMLTFTVGPIVMAAALPILILYPVNRTFMTQIKEKMEVHS
ncbi:MAG TPA: MFS transporter [Anaerohalosphaeraceae bacterium]|nr:MFS transporter [Phycisphaerae bacterium]HOK94658.1 MFS transporter [Anaerohalosphaeraceae bacterium]HOL31358.1 MFS transporter [Anaerohalosphaeraceae bacterium]HOM75186.1 MFS transporter [Anaerohalosphaeraceae bacterium]HPC63567.1 MFS transporter [Anaerohalosphaeraceae bacterium]